MSSAFTFGYALRKSAMHPPSASLSGSGIPRMGGSAPVGLQVPTALPARKPNLPLAATELLAGPLYRPTVRNVGLGIGQMARNFGEAQTTGVEVPGSRLGKDVNVITHLPGDPPEGRVARHMAPPVRVFATPQGSLYQKLPR